MARLIRDIEAMGGADWLRLARLLGVLAITYAIGMEAGAEWRLSRKRAWSGWLAFAFIAFVIAMSEIADHSGTTPVH
jgi:hypothetical protein